MAKAPGFTITLPDEALAMIKQLEPVGLYGTNRAEIARQLILDHLKLLRANATLPAKAE
jgi:hypothetical protein